MIYEIAHIVVKADMREAFERGAAEAAPLFLRARGCRSSELQRGMEQPLRYRLVVGWDTVEDHTKHFRASENFQSWRRLVGHYFDSPPQGVHVESVRKAF